MLHCLNITFFKSRLLPCATIGAPCLAHNYIVARQANYGHTYMYMYICAKLPGTPLDLWLVYYFILQVRYLLYSMT